MTEEELRDACLAGYDALSSLMWEVRRLRAELASERAKHQELWQLVDNELDRIYVDAKGIDQ